MQKLLGKFVIVRAHTAGVHAGVLESFDKDTAILINSIRLWCWYGGSLSQVAERGPANGDNKFGAVVPRTAIVSPQGFEILECTAAAEVKIISVTPWIV